MNPQVIALHHYRILYKCRKQQQFTLQKTNSHTSTSLSASICQDLQILARAETQRSRKPTPLKQLEGSYRTSVMAIIPSPDGPNPASRRSETSKLLLCINSQDRVWKSGNYQPLQRFSSTCESHRIGKDSEREKIIGTAQGVTVRSV